ncbi:MAG: glycosyltransferase [Coriobacteriales bacterium]|jgi:glycosyltransferase involved in cell wall biosynthesis|nr:glycosyltransferase [Coriobacteriales bacterium]
MSNTHDKKLPDVSVVVPCYNAGRYLAQCLESILGQSHTGLEVVCLNDGSTDGSLAVMQEYAERDVRVVVVDKPNEGYGATCNRGIDEASGTYISIVEPDDWIEQGMYEDMLAFASRFASPPDMVKTPYWRILMPDTPQQRKLNCSYRHRIRPPCQPFEIGVAPHLLCHHPSIWSALYRKAFLDDCGIRFMPIPGAGWADNPFLIETCCQARSIVYLDRPYYCYREETPESYAAFARNHTLVPFQRWNEQMDVLERLNVTDEGVLRAQNSRGFTYLAGITAEVPLEDPALHVEAERMFSRMDVDLVLSDAEIPPRSKDLFLELRGLPPQRTARLPYWLGLVAQGLYTLRNTGLRFTLQSLTDFLKRQ